MLSAASISTVSKAAAASLFRASKLPATTRPIGLTSARYLSAAVDRPFQILGVQQIAIGSANKAGLDALWNGIFGFEASASKRLEAENVEEDILKVGTAPYEVEVDLMVPIDENKSPKVWNSMLIWKDDDGTWYLTILNIFLYVLGSRPAPQSHWIMGRWFTSGRRVDEI